MTEIVLLGGPYDHRRVELTRTPPRILVGSVAYRLITDPDTGESLGGYLIESPEETP